MFSPLTNFLIHNLCSLFDDGTTHQLVHGDLLHSFAYGISSSAHLQLPHFARQWRETVAWFCQYLSHMYSNWGIHSHWSPCVEEGNDSCSNDVSTFGWHHPFQHVYQAATLYCSQPFVFKRLSEERS